jgi:hypothetical protein
VPVVSPGFVVPLGNIKDKDGKLSPLYITPVWQIFFQSLNELNNLDSAYLSLISDRVDALRQTPSVGPVAMQARAGRLAALAAQSTADSNTARLKELEFMAY